MSIVEAIKNKEMIKKIENILCEENYRNYVLFCLGINSGLRISDILKLNVEDVKNKDFIQIYEQKTGKFKKFPINKKLKSIFKKYLIDMELSEPLFKSKLNNRMNRITAYKIIKDVCNKVNLKINAGTHTLRKTFGYHHYKQFNDVVLLQKILNHSNTGVTLRYIGIEQDEIDYSYKNFLL